MTWPCSICTYINSNNSATKCFLCGLERDSSVTVNEPKKSKTANDDNKDAGGRKRKAESSSSSSSQLSSVDNAGRQNSSLSMSSSRNNVSKKKKANTSLQLAPIFQQSSSRNFTASKPSSSSSSTTATGTGVTRSFAYTVLPKRSAEKAQRDIQTALVDIFKLKELRYLQPQVVTNALELKSQLVVMATGGGKSLCYQLPACLLGGVTIVISPLLALMKDQVESLNVKGIPAACVNSNQTEKQNREILERLVPSSSSKTAATTTKTKKPSQSSSASRTPVLLYITPESIQTDRMRSILDVLHTGNRLSMFAVDEAHCLSSWGHDFRTSYRQLHYLREKYPSVPCMACTATATPQVIQDITNELHLSGCPKHVGSFDRENIFYKVRYKDGMDDPLANLIKYVSSRHDESKKRGDLCSGIVYCHKRDDTSMIAHAISKRAGVNAKPYHAGLKKHERNDVQELWSKNEVQVAVATVAFGMGIDLAHVRYVIHWSLPKSVEGFYQESGRAGRDGLPSQSVLYYSKSDAEKFRFLINMQAEKSRDARAMSAEEKRKSERNASRQLRQLDSIEKYCSEAKCRRNTLISHFGGAAVDCNKSCDYCNNPKKVERAMAACKAVKDVRNQYKTMMTKSKFGEEGNRNNDFGGLLVDDDEGEDNWGWGAQEDGFIVDGLQITGPMEMDDESPGDSTTKTTRNPDASFKKASDILSKYGAMEKRAQKSGTMGGFQKASEMVSSKLTSVAMPAHLFASVKSSGSNSNSIPKKKVISSAEHGAKADRMEEKLKQMKAESEARLAALRAKQSSKPPPRPPPPPQLQFGRKKK